MYIFIIIIIIIIICALKQDYNTVPKIIWTYLDSEKINKCIESWKKYTDYEIIILTKKNYMGYVTIPTNLLTNPVFNLHFSELIRLYILYEMGGVWIDPNVLLTAPLDWMFPKYAEFSGFKNDIKGNIETWFMACNKGSLFMKKWRDEFSQIARYPSVDKYIESKGFKCSAIQTAQKMIDMKDKLILRNSDGPLHCLKDANWNSETDFNDSEKILRLALLSNCHIIKLS